LVLGRAESVPCKNKEANKAGSSKGDLPPKGKTIEVLWTGEDDTYVREMVHCSGPEARRTGQTRRGVATGWRSATRSSAPCRQMIASGFFSTGPLAPPGAWALLANPSQRGQRPSRRQQRRRLVQRDWCWDWDWCWCRGGGGYFRPAARSYRQKAAILARFIGNNTRRPLFFSACVGMVLVNNISARKISRREGSCWWSRWSCSLLSDCKRRKRQSSNYSR
jgi:hypothetical protein